jgi:hypothetical protein
MEPEEARIARRIAAMAGGSHIERSGSENAPAADRCVKIAVVRFNPGRVEELTNTRNPLERRRKATERDGHVQLMVLRQRWRRKHERARQRS